MHLEEQGVEGRAGSAHMHGQHGSSHAGEQAAAHQDARAVTNLSAGMHLEEQ